MKSVLIKTYAFSLTYALDIVSDVKEEDMAISPGAGLENHPAFTLGHLASAAALTDKYLGGDYDFDAKWENLFRRKGPGDPRKPDPNKELYPSKPELISALEKYHERVEKRIIELDEMRMGEPTKWRFSGYMPTLGDLLYFMCVSHESMHLGQLAAWRRAMGYPSSLGRL